MAPTIRPGDCLRVLLGTEARVGQVVVARTDSGLVVHRLIARRGDRLVLRGDNAPRADAPIAASAVLGHVSAVERPDGRTRRLDMPGSRIVALATAAYGQAQAAVGRGPRPKHVPALAGRIGRRLLGTTSAEESFVLLVARRRISAVAAELALDLAHRGLDWNRVVSLAVLGQLGPLLYLGTRQLGPDSHLPNGFSQRLQTLYAASWQRGRRLEDLLAQLLERLSAEAIPVLAHKGAALALTVFDDWALHLSGDLDLSVPDADYERAVRLTHDIWQPLADANPDRRHPGGYHVELDRAVHHDLEPSRHGGGRWQAGQLDWPRIWAGAQSAHVRGHRLLVPNPTDLVLTLVANAVRRGFTPVRLISDLAETIDRYGETDRGGACPTHSPGSDAAGPTIDWPRLEAELRRSRLDRRAWIALDLCADWFDAQIPPQLLEPPPDLKPAAYEWWILEHKRRRPFWRVPTRVLWAGSARAALVMAFRLAGASMARQRRRPPDR